MRTRGRCLVLVLSLFPARAGLMAQETTIRTRVPLVVLPTGVSNSNGQPLPGLTAADFIILDDGKSRPVFVEDADLDLRPLALVVVIPDRRHLSTRRRETQP